jgi:hypothetical protein
MPVIGNSWVLPVSMIEATFNDGSKLNLFSGDTDRAFFDITSDSIEIPDNAWKSLTSQL